MNTEIGYRRSSGTGTEHRVANGSDICDVSFPDVSDLQAIASCLEKRIQGMFYTHNSDKLIVVYCI
jgi:hypothetical protein